MLVLQNANPFLPFGRRIHKCENVREIWHTKSATQMSLIFLFFFLIFQLAQVRDEWLSKMAQQSDVLREKESQQKNESGGDEMEEGVQEVSGEGEEEDDEEKTKWMEEVVGVQKLRLTVEETETMRNKIESELMLKVMNRIG